MRGSHRGWILALVALSIVASAATLCHAQSGARATWSDKTGKFSVEARFERLDGETVVLVTTDGRHLKVPIDRLSDADAQYVQGLAIANPFQEFTSDDSRPAGNTGRQADWRDVREVRPKSFSKWTFTPKVDDTTSATEVATGRDLQVTLKDIPNSDRFFEKIEGVYAANDGSRAIVVRQIGSVRQDKQFFCETIESDKRTSRGMVALPPESAVLDVLPEKNLVMYRSDKFDPGVNKLLTIARLEGIRLTTVAAWEPYAHEDWEPRRNIEKAWFLDTGRVMTTNAHGRALTIWDVATSKALVNLPIETSFFIRMGISPDRQLMAIAMKSGIALIDLTAGKHVATITTGDERFNAVEIRRDNRRLAGISAQGVTIWDLTTGEKMASLDNPLINFHSELSWAGDYLFVGNKFLFDVERRIVLWEYQDGPFFGNEGVLRGGRMWTVPENPGNPRAAKTLISVRLPHPAPIRMAKSLPSAEELLVVRPGAEVAIDVDIDPTIDMSEELRRTLNGESNGQTAASSNIVVLGSAKANNDVVRQWLQESLEKSGFRVVDDSKLVLKAICKPQARQTIRINIDNRWPVRKSDIVERTITPHASYLEMSLDGEPVWKRGWMASPVS